MTEEENVQEQVAPEQEEQEQVAQQQPAATIVDRNWQQASEVMRLQKQRIEELEARMSQVQQPQAPPEKDEFDDLDPEDYMTVGKYRALTEKTVEKKAKAYAQEMLREYDASQRLQKDEDRMRNKHEDYDYVIDNFVLPLIKQDAALAHKLQTSKNPAEVAYKLGKLSDSYEEMSVPQKTSPKAEKILKNASRPTSGNAAGSSLKGQAEAVANMSPSQVWQMSQQYAKGA